MKQLSVLALIFCMLHLSVAGALAICSLNDLDGSEFHVPREDSHDHGHADGHPTIHCPDADDYAQVALTASGAEISRPGKGCLQEGASAVFSAGSLSARIAEPPGGFLQNLPRHLYLLVLQI
jgi:hypothetical protein